MLRPILILTALLLWLPPVWAQEGPEPFERAARQLWQDPKVPRNKPLSLDLVNQTTGSKDRTARRLEAGLSLALNQQGFTLLRAEDSLSGVGSGVIALKGAYQTQGDRLLLSLRAQHMTTGEVYTQLALNLPSDLKTHAELFAVLDIESADLNEAQIQFFSDAYRAALRQTAGLKVASSAEVDKMDPEQVQKTLGCTRDECATVIGEQLGVDHVVSTSLAQIDQGLYGLTSKVIGIESGVILASTTVKHQGRLSQLDQSLDALAKDLALQLKKAPPAPAPVPAPAPAAQARRLAPEPQPGPKALSAQTPSQPQGEGRLYMRQQTSTLVFKWSDGSTESISFAPTIYGLKGLGEGGGAYMHYGEGEFDQFLLDGEPLENWSGSYSEFGFGFEGRWFGKGVAQGNQLTFGLGFGMAIRQGSLQFRGNAPVEFTSLGYAITAGLDYVTPFGLYLGGYMELGLFEVPDFTSHPQLNENLQSASASAVGMTLGLSF